MRGFFRCCSPSRAACWPPSREKRRFIRTGACSTSPASTNDLLECGTELRGLIGGQLNDEPATTFQRDAHHDATALLGHLERAIARPRLHRRHAASPSSTHTSCEPRPARPRPRPTPDSNNRVDPSPYYPVFGPRMVMISYARRLPTGDLGLLAGLRLLVSTFEHDLSSAGS